MTWFRSKQSDDPRDTTIASQAIELGQLRADLKSTQSALETANRCVSDEQAARFAAERSHTNLVVALKKAHATAISLIETERDKALARLTAAELANMDALLDELTATKALLAKADEDKAVLAADAADLRTQLGRERDDHRAFRRQWADHLSRCTVADEITQEDAAKARTR